MQLSTFGNSDFQLCCVTSRDGAQGLDTEINHYKYLKCLELYNEKEFVQIVELPFIGSDEVSDELIKKSISMQHRLNLLLTIFGRTIKTGESIENSDAAKMVKLVQLGALSGTFVCKSREMDVRGTLQISPEENLLNISQTLIYVKKHGLAHVILDLEHAVDAWCGRGEFGNPMRSDLANSNRKYLYRVIETANNAGVDRLVICDTNGGAMPEEIASLFADITSKYPQIKFGIHCHRDRNMAEINSLEALKNGAVHIDGTINGYGERAGNTNFCTLIPLLYETRKDLQLKSDAISSLTRLANMMASAFGREVDEQQPFVGEHVFGSSAGIHLASMLKDSEGVYLHKDPVLYGNKARIRIDRNSGRANIKLLAKQHGITLTDEQASKIILQYPKMVRYGAFSFCREAFILACMEMMGELPEFFKIIKHIYHGASGKKNMAFVQVQVASELIKNYVTSADGPYDALSGALFEILISKFHGIDDIELLSFTPKIISVAERGSGAIVRVVSQFGSNGDVWKGVGVDPDLPVAGFKALVMGIKWFLFKQYAQKGSGA